MDIPIIAKEIKNFISDNNKIRASLAKDVLKGKAGDTKNFFWNIKWFENMEQGVDLRGQFMDEPENMIKAIGIGALEVAKMDSDLTTIEVRITGLNPDPYIIKQFGKMSWQKSIQELDKNVIDKLMVVEGLIRSKTDIVPELQSKTYECGTCAEKFTMYKRNDIIIKPFKCYATGQCNGKYFKQVSRVIENKIVISLEESQEDAKGSEVKKTSVVCKGNLASPDFEKRLMRGNRIKVIGILRVTEKTADRGHLIKTDLIPYVEANNIELLQDEYEEIHLTEEDRKKIRDTIKDKDAVVYYAEQVYSHIYGYDESKKALICQMVGIDKVQKQTKSTRGTIHLLFLGDPGSGKSTLLKITQTVSLKCLYASGKSTSAVGITANVAKDETVGSWVVQAGAFPLAHKGILCLDEFDKISNEDKSALHEGMEESTITVHKANVHATLIAETSLLAAANPKEGRFDNNKEIYEQFNLMPTLVNRFDLIFVFKDMPDKVTDSEVAKKIISGHISDSKEKDDFDVSLFKKYLIMCKEINPTIDKKTTKKIEQMYLDVRERYLQELSDKGIKSMPISPRQLESGIRLAKTHARANLKEVVDVHDVEFAINLVTYMLGQISTDLITGKVDVDVIETGISAGKRSLQDAIEAFIKSKENQECPIEDLINAFTESVGEKKVDEMISKMKLHGDIIEPRRGTLKWLS